MTDSGHARRREAALRLPPLADGRRDPVLEADRPLRRPAAVCSVCLGRPRDGGTLAYIFGKWMCRDRVDCYQRFKKLT